MSQDGQEFRRSIEGKNMGGMPVQQNSNSGGGLAEVMAHVAAKVPGAVMAENVRQSVVINVSDIMMDEVPARRDEWLQVIAEFAADHQIILAVPRHNTGLDEFIEFRLSHALGEDKVNLLRHGPERHVLASYRELQNPEAGILATAPHADIFVSAHQRSDDVRHAMYINPTFAAAPALLAQALQRGTARNRYDLPPVAAGLPAAGPAEPARR